MKAKKVLSAILCIVMVLSTMSFTAFAEEQIVAKIGTTEYTSFAEALAAIPNDGTSTEIILYSGTYEIPNGGIGSNAVVTFTEAPDNEVTLDGTKLGNEFYGDEVVFNNLTIKFPDTHHRGLTHTNKVIYNNCTFSGTQTLYAPYVEFNNCTFEGNDGKDIYYVWTYGIANAIFNDCLFNTNGKAILCYHDGGYVDANVTLTNCTFNSDNTIADDKAAVEVGSDNGLQVYHITFINCTANGFNGNPKGTPTGSTLWGNKNSLDYDHLGVTINGKNVSDSLYRSLTVAVDEETASVDDVVEADVVVNGNGMTFADWTFEYDPNVFSCTEDADGDGKIEGNSYSGTTPYNDGEIIKTYELVVKAQEYDETETTLKFSDDSVVGNDDDSIAGELQRETELILDTVTIMFKDFDTVKTFVDGVKEATSPKTIQYDAKNHTFEVISEADANVAYIIEKDGQVVDISVDEIKDMGTYVIKYTVTKKGYNDKSGEFTIIITQPDNEIELVPNFVKGKVAVLVYTNIEDISYQYDNNLMVDVTAKYSKAGYKRVFGYVTEPLKDSNDNVTLDKAVYAEKLLAEVTENASLAIITKIDYDLVEDDIVNYLDVNAGYGVYNARTAYFNVNAMKIVFKADVNSDKAVTFDDAEAVYNVVYKSAE